MPLLTWQLWLARDLVRDSYLSWQKPLTNLTPGRVASVDVPTFGHDWHTSSSSKTTRKVARLANWSTPHSQNSLSNREKRLMSVSKSSKSGFLIKISLLL
jgi:hypothetical protein